MSVASLAAIEQTIRTRLLTFVPSSGTALATLLGATTSGAGADGKLYVDQPAEDVTGFYGVLRLIDVPVAGFDGGSMIRGQAELVLYGRPRTQGRAVKLMGAVVLEAWQGFEYTEPSGRCLVARDASNAQMLFFQDPADRDLVAFRVLLPFMATPTFLAP